jgi:hypothetical protein
VQQNIRIVHATEVSIEAPNVTIKGALTVTETFNEQNAGGVTQPAMITKGGTSRHAGALI